MKVYFSTVVRGAPVEQGGEVVMLDWGSKKVLEKLPLFPGEPVVVDPNPRGNARGGKGIVVVGDEVVAATYHSLHLFTRNLEPTRVLSHPLFAGIHELHYCGRGSRIWVTSTSIDAALEVDLTSGRVERQYWPREMPTFQKAFGLTPLEIDKTADNRLTFLGFRPESHVHLNAMATWRGDVYGFLNVQGAVVNLSSPKVVLTDPRVKRGHNVGIADDGTIFVNDTRGHYLRVYDMNSGKQTREINLMTFDWVKRRLARHTYFQPVRKFLGHFGFPQLARSEPLFVRGLKLVGDQAFVGASPAMILQIDLPTGKLTDAYNYSRDLDCCVHGLWVES